MTRFRGAAALLAAVATAAAVGTAAVGTGVAGAAPPRLSPTPPVPLPAHVTPGHRHRPSRATAPARKPLPKTGLSLARELLLASALLLLGWSVRALTDRRLQ